jgi:hypothetical protein
MPSVSRPTGPGPGKSRRRQWAIAAALAGLLTLGIVLAAFQAPPREERKFVAVYVTDLPGGLERLEVTFAACIVGTREQVLDLEEAVVELSALQGPEEALRICSGWVDLDTDGRVSLLFDRVRGYRNGAWEDLQLPSNRLTLPQAFPADDARRVSTLFDFSLETSIVQRDGALRFEPFIQSIYYVDQSTTNNNKLLPDDLIQVEFPQQVLDTLDEIRRYLCQLLNDCPDEGDGGSSEDPLAEPTVTTPTTDLTCLIECVTIPTNPTGGPTNPTTPTGPIQVSPPTTPTPIVGATVTTAGVTLSWQAPSNWPTARFDVVLDGTTVCTDLATTTCAVAAIGTGTDHVWSVTARSGMYSARSPDWNFVTQRPPASAALLAPTHELTGVDGSSVEFRWRGEDADSKEALQYRVVMSASNPPGVVRCDWTSQESCVVSSLAFDTVYYWKVVTKDGSVQVSSEIRSFTTAPGGGEPSPPNLLCEGAQCIS